MPGPTAVKKKAPFVDYLNRIKETTTLWLVLTSIIIVGGGVVLLHFSEQHDFWHGYEAWQRVVRELGALLLVTLAVSLLWELLGKRRLLDEILTQVGVAKEIDAAGIIEIYSDFYQIDWKPYFQNVREVDLFFAWAHTWRNSNRADLENIASKRDVSPHSRASNCDKRGYFPAGSTYRYQLGLLCCLKLRWAQFCPPQ